MNDEKSVVKTLAELGFYAAFYGHYEEAEEIAEGLIAYDADSPVPYMILSLLAINKEQTQDAIEYLGQAEKYSPDDLTIKSLLAMAMQVGGLSTKSDQLISDILADSNVEQESAAIALADSLLHTANHQKPYGVISW